MLGEFHQDTAISVEMLGALYKEQGLYEQSEALLLEAHRVYLDSLGHRSQYAKDALEKLVDLYSAWGKPEMAAEYRTLLEEAEKPEP